MDKILHCGVCAIASLVVGLIDPLAGAAFAIGLGLGKEYGDSKARGNKWDWLDIAADAVGTMIGTGLALLIRKLF